MEHKLFGEIGRISGRCSGGQNVIRNPKSFTLLHGKLSSRSSWVAETVHVGVNRIYSVQPSLILAGLCEASIPAKYDQRSYPAVENSSTKNYMRGMLPPTTASSNSPSCSKFQIQLFLEDTVYRSKRSAPAQYFSLFQYLATSTKRRQTFR